MSAFNYRGCLSGYAINSGILSAFYDFSSGSGNVLFNSLHSPSGHFSENKLIASKDPGVFIRSGSSLPNSLTGRFDGRDTFLMASNFHTEAFSFLVDYDMDFCGLSGTKSSILVSSLTEGTGISGFAFGFNQGNRLFFEYFNNTAQKTGIVTLNRQLGNKNSVILSSVGNGSIDIGYFNYENDTYVGERFSVPGYSHSNKIYVGGLKNYSGSSNSGFSGNFNSVLYFTGHLSDDLKTKCVECLFSSGVSISNQATLHSGFLVTGFQFSSSGVSGVTGYSLSQDSISHPTGGSSIVWRESGVSGVLNTVQVVTPLTGANGSSQTIIRSLDFNIDYSSKQEYGIKNIVFNPAIPSGWVVEIYSYQRPQRYFNLESNNFSLNKSGFSQAQLFHNGMFNLEGFDYFLSSNTISGVSIQGYDSTDYFNYNLFNENVMVTNFSGLWSGSKILLNSPTSGTGASHFPNRSQYTESGTDILITGISGVCPTGYDLFLNGQKLVEGYSYESAFSGSVPLLKLYGTLLPSFYASVVYTGAGFVSGHPSYPPSGITNVEDDLLVFVQKPTGVAVNRYVSVSDGFLVNARITGFSQQVWINGKKEHPDSFKKTYPCSPTSGAWAGEFPSFLFYNNSTSYINIE